MGSCFISRDCNCDSIPIHCDDTENSCDRLVISWPLPQNNVVTAWRYNISNCTKLNKFSTANVISWSGDAQWPARDVG
jgi:hypothetical protein